MKKLVLWNPHLCGSPGARYITSIKTPQDSLRKVTYVYLIGRFMFWKAGSSTRRVSISLDLLSWPEIMAQAHFPFHSISLPFQPSGLLCLSDFKTRRSRPKDHQRTTAFHDDVDFAYRYICKAMCAHDEMSSPE